MKHRTSSEALEVRQLLAFAELDSFFNLGKSIFLGNTASEGAMVVPLADGGSIVQAPNGELRRYSATGVQVKGRSDRFGGVDGVIGTPNNAAQLLVGAGDPATGRIATFFEDSRNERRQLRLYSANGKLLNSSLITLTYDNDNVRIVPKLAFDSFGRLLLAIEANVTILKRFTVDGQPDTTFGDDGTLTLDVPQDHFLLSSNVLALEAGPNGQMLVAVRGSQDPLSELARIFVLDSNGQPRSGFGDGGHVDLPIASRVEDTEAIGTNTSRTLLSLAMTPSGSILIVSRDTTNTFNEIRGNTTNTNSLQRVSPAGVVGDRYDLSLALSLNVQSSAQIAFDGPQATLIIGGEPFIIGTYRADVTHAARIIRFDADDSDPSNFVFDTAYNGPNGRQFVQSFSAADAAFDTNGRLLLVGSRELYSNDLQHTLLAVEPTGLVQHVVQAGVARIIGDAVLDVVGTDSADVIKIDMDTKFVRVTINGAVQSFSRQSVAGLLVEGLKGSDRIEIGASVRTAYVQGGDGNDTILGSDRPEIIEGNKGNDYLDGRGGDDLLFGAADKDVLLGGFGSDSLYGGSGNDAIYGSFADRADDAAKNLLVGGPGIDRLLTSRHSNDFDQQDETIEDSLDALA